jgi:hypothetical protein
VPDHQRLATIARSRGGRAAGSLRRQDRGQQRLGGFAADIQRLVRILLGLVGGWMALTGWLLRLQGGIYLYDSL